jgi:hypothetical protein
MPRTIARANIAASSVTTEKTILYDFHLAVVASETVGANQFETGLPAADVVPVAEVDADQIRRLA